MAAMLKCIFLWLAVICMGDMGEVVSTRTRIAGLVLSKTIAHTLAGSSVGGRGVGCLGSLDLHEDYGISQPYGYCLGAFVGRYKC